VPKMSQVELRRKVNQILERKVSNAVWEYLVRHQFVAEALGENDPVAFLAKDAEELSALETLAEPAMMPERRQRRGKRIPLRREVISDLIAAIARKDHRLRFFRSEYLASGLLAPEDVEDWIRARLGTERYRNAIIVKVPEIVSLDLGHNGWECSPPLSLVQDIEIENPAPSIVLEYSKPTTSAVHRIPVGRDGVLRILVNLADSLATKYSWQPAQATMFVLTDYAPVLSPDQAAIKLGHQKFGPLDTRSLDCLSRVVITVDPCASPQEVAKLYAKTRGKYLRQLRGLGEKHLRLAGFASECEELSRGMMDEWNRRYPNWRYRRYSLFTRDMRKATTRLLTGSSLDSRSVLFDIFKW
jgi:hypothetical protein